MRTQVTIVVVAVLLAVYIGFLVQSATHADPPATGKFQLVADGGRMYLLDTSTGAVWLRFTMREGGGGRVIDEWRLETITFPQPPAASLRRAIIPK